VPAPFRWRSCQHFNATGNKVRCFALARLRFSPFEGMAYQTPLSLAYGSSFLDFDKLVLGS